MVRDRAPPTQGTERGLTRGPVPLAVPAGDGPPNTPSGTGPAKNRGPVPVESGDRSPDASGTGPHRTQQIRGPVPTKAQVTARAAPSLVPETRSRRRAPGTGTVAAPPLRVLAGRGNQPPEALVPNAMSCGDQSPSPSPPQPRRRPRPSPSGTSAPAHNRRALIALIPTRPNAPESPHAPVAPRRPHRSQHGSRHLSPRRSKL